MAYEVLMPQLGLTMEEGTVSRWLKQEGDTVKIGEELLEITTDKLTNTVACEHDGVLLKITAQEGEDVPVKGLLAYIGKAGEAVEGVISAPAATAPAPAADVPPVSAATAPANGTSGGSRVRISPLARKIAAKLGVDCAGVAGSGPAGRIVAKDVYAAADGQKAVNRLDTPVPSAVPAAEKKAATARMDGDTVSKLSGMRRVVSERMFQSHSEIPPVTQNIKVDVTELMKLRKTLEAVVGKKYSVNDLILKAAAKCLRAHPEMLVSYDDGCIIQHTHVNLGMAVALDVGLIVPVIRDADRLGLDALSEAAKDLASRAKENRLTADEYKGSTFSVSNLGMFGIETFTPIINQPDAAILGVCAIEDELSLDGDGAVAVRKVMRLSLTYDHRLLDGAVAAKFEMDLRDLIQTPINILL